MNSLLSAAVIPPLISISDPLSVTGVADVFLLKVLLIGVSLPSYTPAALYFLYSPTPLAYAINDLRPPALVAAAVAPPTDILPPFSARYATPK